MTLSKKRFVKAIWGYPMWHGALTEMEPTFRVSVTMGRCSETPQGHPGLLLAFQSLLTSLLQALLS